MTKPERTLADTAIIGLAGARLTRLVVTDTITQPVRVWIKMRWPGQTGIFKAMHRDTDGEWRWKDPRKTPTRPATFLGKLIECPWCTSVYVTAAASLAYRWRATRWGVRLIAAMHIAALGVTYFEHHDEDPEDEDAPKVDLVAAGETKKVEPNRYYTEFTAAEGAPEQVAAAVVAAQRSPERPHA